MSNRRHPRYPFHAEVRYVSGGHQHTHLAENIGLGGLFIRTVRPLPPGTPVRLAIDLPGDDAPREVEGEVAWMIRVDPPDPERHRTGMGIEFRGPAPFREAELERLTQSADDPSSNVRETR